jgi:type I restriction enzyme S subunit
VNSQTDRLREVVASGNGQPNLNTMLIKGLALPFPPIGEQQAISKAIGSVNNLLAALTRLVVKKRALKQAAMQQLLTGRTRLPGSAGGWERRKLEEIGRFSKGRGIRKDEVVTEGLPCIRYGEIYTHHDDYVKSFVSFISRSVASQSQRIQKGDLLFAGSGETAEEIGKCVAYLEEREAYAGGDIVILRPVEQDSLFLGYLMNHQSVVEQKVRMGQGDAVVHISARNLAQISIPLPSRKEQTAIANVLRDMDAEIDALKARLEKTRALKQGMMQELLTGRTRLV